MDAIGAGAAGSWAMNNLGPKVADRDFAPGFRAAFWADTKVMHLLRRHNAALRSAWAARSWYPHGASLAAIEADMLNCGLVCDNYAVDLHGKSIPTKVQDHPDKPVDTARCNVSVEARILKKMFIRLR